MAAFPAHGDGREFIWKGLFQFAPVQMIKQKNLLSLAKKVARIGHSADALALGSGGRDDDEDIHNMARVLEVSVMLQWARSFMRQDVSRLTDLL
ncbi:MAG: hypothetical protein A2X46_15985 [Lentisphaerae bacterium GWF2_57_35]|nr:MAG: hypothetical protein A2X46_15985 [Lentisphaerae bacterium GWF2_57_35]